MKRRNLRLGERLSKPKARIGKNTSGLTKANISLECFNRTPENLRSSCEESERHLDWQVCHGLMSFPKICMQEAYTCFFSCVGYCCAPQHQENAGVDLEKKSRGVDEAMKVVSRLWSCRVTESPGPRDAERVPALFQPPPLPGIRCTLS